MKFKNVIFEKICYAAVLIAAVIMSHCVSPEKKPVTALSGTFSGRAIITEIIDTAGENKNGTAGYRDIYFKFIPSDPGASKNYLCSTCSDSKIKLFYDNRDSFHSNWIEKWDIKPGREYAAIRHEFIKEDKTALASYEVFLEPGK